MSTQTITASRSSSPDAVSCATPAREAAEDGSQKTPSRRARSRYADRICSSVTARISPSDSSRAAVAFCHEAGLPIRIAVATVSGRSTTCPSTIGAAPSAWNPNIRGSDELSPAP